MRIAVTGATGFIGRHVLAELKMYPINVVGVVRNISSAISIFNDIEFVQIDLDNPPKNSFEIMGRPDMLIHLAWGGLPYYYSLHHFEHELHTQYAFLSQIVRSGLSGLVAVGTCFEYGMQSGQLNESMMTYPENPYGFAKDTLRRQFEFLQKSELFSLTWARLFYLYGDGQSETSLLPQLKRAVEQGDEVFNMSGGEQLRDYIAVTDVAKSLVALAINGADIGIVNICSGKPTSVRKLVENWIRENGWDINLNLGYYPYPAYEPLAFWGDRRKLDTFLARI